MNHQERLEAVEKQIQYCFSNRQLLLQALIHKSYASRHQLDFHYERLEFLGDSLLQSYITEMLYHLSEEDQGILTKKRAQLVSRDTLSRIVREMGLEPYILVQENLRNEEGLVDGGFLGDFFESILAAIYLDGGADCSNEFLDRVYRDFQDWEVELDYKSRLQEFSLKTTKQLPVYDTIQVPYGYQAKVFVDGELLATGSGSSKKKAEQVAAKHAISSISS